MKPTNRMVQSKLLAACIEHLELLKSHGVRFVPVSNSALQGLIHALERPIENGDISTKASEPMPPGHTRAEPKSIAPSKTGPAPEQKVTGVPLLSQNGSQAIDRTRAMEALKLRASACQKCSHLVSARTQVVFGVGNVHTELMFIGEAPGAEEDAQGEPFVGKAGQLLTKIIQTMGLSRESVYIANILKCRPDTPGQNFGNRKPREEEMQTCIPYLHEQIDIIQPKVLVALGATAVEGLLGKSSGITRIRGSWHDYRGIPTMPTYHPSYLLRNQSLAVKRQVWEDMLSVMTRLGMPILEKQRGYFLPKGES